MNGAGEDYRLPAPNFLFTSAKPIPNIVSCKSNGVMKAKEGAMSFQIGIAQWLSFFLALLIFSYSVIRRKHNFKYAAFFIICFIFSVFLMLPHSKPLWLSIERYVMIDFPWRILALIIFISSYFAGYAIYGAKNKHIKFLHELIHKAEFLFSFYHYTRVIPLVLRALGFYKIK